MFYPQAKAKTLQILREIMYRPFVLIVHRCDIDIEFANQNT